MKLTRVLQLTWILVAAIGAVQAYLALQLPQEERTSAYIWMGMSVFAAVRYFMLRRQQFKEKKNNGDFD